MLFDQMSYVLLRPSTSEKITEKRTRDNMTTAGTHIKLFHDLVHEVCGIVLVGLSSFDRVAKALRENEPLICLEKV